MKILDTKWVFSKKEIGNKELCKARLVVLGYQQKDQIEDVYSPVVKMQTLRIFLSIALKRNYKINQMDVKGAFLYGKIEELVYLKLPKGCETQERDKYILKLEKNHQKIGMTDLLKQ